MILTKKLLTELQKRLKIGSRRGVHLNAIPGNSLYKFDIQRLSIIKKELPNQFIESLLTELPLKFKISWKDNISDLNDLDKEEQSALVKITKSLENLINQTDTIESEKGINTFGFGFPLLVRRDQSDNKLTVAPILIWSLKINRTNEFNTWIIQRNEDDPIYINELLINHIQNELNASINQISSDMLDDGLIDKNELIDLCYEILSVVNTKNSGNLKEIISNKLKSVKSISDRNHYEKLIGNSSETLIEPCGLFSIFEVQKQNIIDEYDLLLKLKNEEVVLTDINNHDFQSISSIETDPSQQSILNALKTKRNIIIQGPPGTGKSQSLTAILINALENNKKTIVVCEKNTALEVLYKALSKRDLAKHCALIKDSVKDRRAIVNSVRERADNSNYKSQRYTYSKSNLNGLISAIETYISNINNNHNSLDKKIFGDYNWTNVVGQYLTEIRNNKYYLNLSSVSDKLEFNPEEFNAFIPFIEKGQQLYKQFAQDCKESKVNPESLIGENQFEIEDKIISDLSSYHEIIAGVNSLIRTNFEIYKDEKDFFDSQKLKSLNYKLKTLFSVKKRRIIKAHTKTCNEIRKLIKKIENDNWIVLSKLKEDPINAVDYIDTTALDCISYIQNESTCFANEIAWHQFYNQATSRNKAILDLLKETEDWVKIFIIGYLHLILKKNFTNQLPTNDDDIHSIKKYLSKFGEYQLKYIKELWHSKQIDEAYRFHHDNSNLSIENLYNKRSSLKYKRLSLRQIVKYDIDLFTTFFPVILTTPDVCSNLFRGSIRYFDIVLFDEASQLRIEDNLPALLKGKQIIIAGDEHQMPPSNYFSKIFDGTMDDEDEFEEEEQDIIIDRDNILLSCESLLDIGEELSFEKRFLDFHYRSKHPFLIDFSNHAFYHNRLCPLPNNSDYNPMKFIQCDGTFSDHCNEREAEYIIQILEKGINRLSNGKYPTVGIATFNIAQRNLIQSKILERRKFDKYADFNIKINELEANGLFIKNLENIQGDERDVIILSTTYGKNKDGKFLHRFGPINHSKGYKLLNVIITRAKLKVYVCTSIPDEVILSYKDFLTSENGNNKRAVFFAYLAYAKSVSENNNELRLSVLNALDENAEKKTNPITLSSELESPFEEEVYSYLLDFIGKDQLKTQVQFAGFRIDIVYESKNKDVPSIAIECDGAAFHSSHEAYLYDYHRQKILENQGFVFHRIWSTHWWKNPKQETKNLVNFIKEVENKQLKKQNSDSIFISNDDNYFIHPDNSLINNKIRSPFTKTKESKINKVEPDEWESENCYWSRKGQPGYIFSPKKNAWYKQKEDSSSNINSQNTGFKDPKTSIIPDKEEKIQVESIVKVKYLNNGRIFRFHFVDSELKKSEVFNGIQKINIRTIVGISLKNKKVGDIVKIGNLDTFVEILEIKNS
ncbi:MAG TPA: hypothetical protein DHV28_17435 [Ignavibacteriales bacterium]|nr:hypothetical protein [Ignavibacteriales bacterium]